MIGIIISKFNNEVKGFNEEDSIFNKYKPLAQKYQIDFCMFSFKRIQQSLKVVEALVYSYKEDSLTLKTVPVPRINIVRNTSYIKNQELISKFEILRNQDIHFINFPLYVQTNKLLNYNYLETVDKLKSYVPPTKRLSYQHLDSFIHQYGKVIIKPIYGCKGRGITIIEKQHENYKIFHTSSKKNAYSIPQSNIKQFFNKAFPNPAAFLVQRWIPFKEYSNRPFDIRAVVQKNGKNKWQITSWIGRVAKERGKITNLSQGGEMVSLVKLELKKEYVHIRKFCLKAAKTFALLYPWAAEMGIDLAIDKNGKLWYIETNYCPEKTRWSTIYKIPFEYAYYLYKK